MEKVYEELIKYFKKATDKDKEEDLIFLKSLEKTDVLISDYVIQLHSRLESMGIVNLHTQYTNISMPDVNLSQKINKDLALAA